MIDIDALKENLDKNCQKECKYNGPKNMDEAVEFLHKKFPNDLPDEESRGLGLHIRNQWLWGRRLPVEGLVS